MILWPDPEKTLRRPHDYVLSAATPEGSAVPSNSSVTVEIPKVVVSVMRSAFVSSDPVARLSGDPR